jgi:hypothetical protein
MVARGDNPGKATERLENEKNAKWDEQALAIDGIYTVKSHGISERHQEISDYIMAVRA